MSSTDIHIDSVFDKNNNAYLSDISLHIPAGSMIALLGGSNSGKSLLLKTLNHNNRLDKLYSSKTVQPSNIITGYCPTEDILIGELTVRETLRYSSQLRNPHESVADRESRIQSLIDAFELSHVADQVIGTLLKRSLSGGQKRRVSVLVELVANPQMLLLDEPTRYAHSIQTIIIT